MKRTLLFAVSVALAASMLPGCTGSDSQPIVSGTPATAAADDQNVPQSDALTSAEAGQVNQANAEPDPLQKPDI
jgi:hypothetical protein